MKILAKIGTHGMLLLLAVALWWYATDKRTAQMRDLRVPIRIAIPKDRIVMSQSAASVSVWLRGPQSVVERIRSRRKLDEIVAVVSLASRTREMGPQKEFSVPLSPEDITGLTADVRIVQIVPDQVDVAVVKRVSKRLTVVPRLTGEPAAGYRIVGEPYVHPAKVVVWGSETVLANTEAIDTKPIDIQGITEDANRTFPWLVTVQHELADSQGRRVALECDEQVWVYVTAGRTPEQRRLDGIPVRVLATPACAFRVKLKDEHVSLVLSGPKHVLDKLSPSDVTAYVKVADLRPAVAPYQQPLVYRLPLGVQLEESPATVDVDVTVPEQGKGGP